jgi:glycosyltransferase involved in cell wall biosynthesis
MKTIGYFIPEFPGQTHIWMWREIVNLRAWGVPIVLFSSRRPPERDRARHGFAEAAANETIYLWPAGVGAIVAALLWALFTRPVGLLRCATLALTLPVDRTGKKKQKLLPMIVPAVLMAKQARARGIDHFHSHTCAGGAILCMMVKRLNGTPFSMTLNANINWWGGAMKEKFEDAAFTVAITKWLLAEMKRDYPTLRPDQAILGRIGVDTQRWTPTEGRADGDAANMAASSPLAPEPSPLRLFTLGRLHISKGHWVVLKAMALLRGRGIATTWRVAGDGPERANIEKLTDELGLKDHVTLLGSQPEDVCLAEMRAADVFVLTSDAEPLGVVYMEAMSTATPTIGTAAGGVGEIITNEVDGILIPPKSPDALADAIERLANDPALRGRVGQAGRASIIQNFEARLGAATLYERIFNTAPPAA